MIKQSFLGASSYVSLLELQRKLKVREGFFVYRKKCSSPSSSYLRRSHGTGSHGTSLAHQWWAKEVSNHSDGVGFGMGCSLQQLEVYWAYGVISMSTVFVWLLSLIFLAWPFIPPLKPPASSLKSGKQSILQHIYLSEAPRSLNCTAILQCAHTV